MSVSTINTDKLFAFLRRLVEGKKFFVQDAHEASNEIYNMAAINSKLDVLNESHRVGMEVLDRKYNSIL